MPTNYRLADLRQILPFTPADRGDLFSDEADAGGGGGNLFYLAEENGLWLYVRIDGHDHEDFMELTGLDRNSLHRKHVGGFLVYGQKDSTPLLPFPFTAAQLVELDQRTGGVFSQQLHGDTDEIIAELAQHNTKAAELARALAYNEMPDGVESGESAREIGEPGASPLPPWIVNRPKRYTGYNRPLHALLTAAHREGKPCPTARDVVDTWRINKPLEIEQVLPDSFDYYDSKGNTKPANLAAIRGAIKRMTSTR